MSKILSDEMYEQAGEEIDKKLEPMQKIIFEQARKKAMGTVEFVEKEPFDTIEDLQEAKQAIVKKMITEIGKTFDPIQLHYTVIIRALDELIMIRNHIMAKRKEE